MPPRNQPTDAYEASLMPADGTVLHRDKQVARKAFFMMAPMALLALLGAIAVALGADPAAPRIAALLPFGVFALTLWAMLTKISIRSVLTTRELQVHWGLRKWTIPIAGITKCETVGVLTTGLSATQVGVNAWAPNGHVLLHWNDAAGKAQKLQFPAEDPTTMVAQIEKARGNGSRDAGLRIGVGSTASDEAAMEGVEPASEKSGSSRR